MEPRLVIGQVNQPLLSKTRVLTQDVFLAYILCAPYNKLFKHQQGYENICRVHAGFPSPGKGNELSFAS